MIEITSSSGSHIELKASGKLTNADYQELIPILQRHHEHAPETNYLLLLEGFEGWEVNPAWQGLRADWDDDKFVRAAVVADDQWAEEALRFARAAFPGNVRHFPSHQLISARGWIREGRHAGASREEVDPQGGPEP